MIKKLVYLAGKITGGPNYKEKENENADTAD